MPAYWKIPKTEGLYFLFNGDELVYIGSTESSGIRNRVYAHEYEDKKQFTSMAFLMKEDLLLNLRDAETYLIIKYSPRYNQLAHADNIISLRQPDPNIWTVFERMVLRKGIKLGRPANHKKAFQPEVLKILLNEI